MTIEINVPIKCSTYKKIIDVKNKTISLIQVSIILLLCPGTVIAFIMGCIALFVGIGDHNTVAFLTLFLGILAIPCTIFGHILYCIAEPFKFKCIQDEANTD